MRVDGKYRIESWPRQFISRQGAKHNTSQLWLIYKNSSAGAAIFRRVLLFKQCIREKMEARKIKETQCQHVKWTTPSSSTIMNHVGK